MARPIDHRSTSPYPADQVFAAITDPEYLRARLRRLGGSQAALLEHHPDGDGVRYRLRFGLDEDVLPGVVRSMIGAALVVERAESVHPAPGGGYRGDVEVSVPNAPVPVSANGSMRLRDLPDGSEFAVHADVAVRVPLIGGRIEDIVAEQVGQLLAAEDAFTREWLGARHP
jgi:hypothetical protein